MILVACVDKNMGLLFNNRRQSRDRVLIERLLNKIGENKIYITEFSKILFSEHESKIEVVEDFTGLKSGEYCFVENVDECVLEDKVEKIIIYDWNKVYPSDKSFNISLDGWILAETEDFVGSSHDKITERVYVKEG